MSTTNGTMPQKVVRQPTTSEVKEEVRKYLKVKEEVKKYSFFNPKLRAQANENGDIYDKEAVGNSRAEWQVISAAGERPYLTHIKLLSETWPQLTLLSDFMEIGTSPVRWKDLDPTKGDNKEEREEHRRERISRTEVTRLDYYASGKVDPKRYQKSEKLKAALDEKTPPTANKRNFRLFIVEDLSRDVIEHLGARYDIEPQFFREHIFDYTWYNTRDRWVDPPRLGTVTKQQPWFQMRFATARYFRTADEFKKGYAAAERFNVLRRPDDDLNTRSNWDQPEAKVGLSRTRTSFWMRKDDPDGPVGVMLVDPTFNKDIGYPLWYGYGNWEKTPSMHEKTPKPPPRKSPYEDIIYWAQKLNAFGSCTKPNPSAHLHVPIQALLYFVSSEWLTMSEYIKTRLGQIEWEISYPEHFLGKEDSIDVALNKLHVWRRLVPLYREMLTDTLHRIFEFPCHTQTIADVAHATTGTDDMAKTANPPGPTIHCQCPLHNPANAKGPIGSMREDFARLLSYMEEYQQRIDRLTSVVTAIISIGDSRTSQADNRNVARLTWLATFFIPMSFVTGLFSMTPDIGALHQTVKWYFAFALPLSIVSLALAWILTLPSVLRWWGRTTKRVNRLFTSSAKKNN